MALNSHSLQLAAASDQCAYHADDTAFDLTDFIIMAWVKITEETSHYILTKAIFGGGGTDPKSYAFNVNWTGTHFQPQLLIAYLSAPNYITTTRTSTGTFAKNEWHHVAVAHSDGADTIRFYIDGVFIDEHASHGAQSIVDTALPLIVGGYRNGTDTANVGVFTGFIDEVFIAAAPASQAGGADTFVASNYKTNMVPQGAGLWHLNNDLLDSSGNGLDLTGQNSPTFSTDIPFRGNTVLGASIV